MAVELATAYISILPTTRGLAAELSKALDDAYRQAQASVQKIQTNKPPASQAPDTSKVKAATDKISGYVKQAQAGVTKAFNAMPASVQKVISASTSMTGKMFDGLKKTAGVAASGVSKAFDVGFGALKGVATTAFTGIATAGTIALTKGFGRLVSLDNAQAKLKGLGNSAEDVETIMNNASASVRGTAFGMDEAATTAANAVAAGVAPGKDLERTLSLVADAATIAGTDMSSMGSIFNKVATANKVQMDVINQLHDAGVPALALLADQMGVTAEEAQAMASAGEVDFATFQAAMEEGLGGAAQSSGDTFSGSMANVQAALGRVGANFMSSIFPKLAPLFKRIQEALGPLEDKAKEFGDTVATKINPMIDKFSAFLERGGASISGVSAKVGPLIGAFSALGASGLSPLLNMIPGLGGLGGVLGRLGGPLGMIAAAFLGLVATSPELQAAFGGLFEQIGGILTDLMPTFQELTTAIMPVISQALEMLIPTLVTVIGIVGEILVALAPFVAFLGGVLVNTINALAPVFTSVFSAIQGVVTSVMNIVLGIIQTVMGIISGDWSAAWEGIKRVGSAAWEFIKSAFSLLFNAIKGIVIAGWEIIKGLFSGAFNKVKGLATKGWNNVKEAFSTGISKAVDLVKGLPGKVLDALGNLGNFLKDSGSALLEGFGKGITAGFEKVKGWVTDGLGKIRSLFPFSPAKEGPFSGKGWVLYSGLSVGHAFGDGIHKSASAARDEALALARDTQAALNGVSANAEFGSSVGSRLSRAAVAGRGGGTSYGDIHMQVNANDLRGLKSLEEFTQRLPMWARQQGVVIV